MYIDCDFNPYQGNPMPRYYLIFDMFVNCNSVDIRWQ